MHTIFIVDIIRTDKDKTVTASKLRVQNIAILLMHEMPSKAQRLTKPRDRG